MRRLLPLAVVSTLALSGCPAEKDGVADTTDTTPAACDPATEWADAPALVAGAPEAGVAERILELPVGTPLSGYTSRCDCFGGAGEPDKRDSAYRYSFNPSGGVQAPVMLKVFWLTNGDQDLVVVKVDLIYSFDGLVEEMEQRLSAATGRDLDGKVIVAANHSHGAYGDFSDQVTYYLGSDRFNYEVFTRLAEQAEETALAAYDGRQPAKVGMSFARDWDPDDRVYRDRRDNNDDLQFFPDIPAGRYKDPTLTLIRIDTLDDEPLGVLFDFGVHGTVLDDDSAMITPDAPGHVETLLQEEFDHPVVVSLLQGGAGDASPAGSDDGYARLETIGVEAASRIYAVWADTPTAADPIYLETASRSIPETHDDIRVTRGGTTDLHYVPYTEGLEPDNVVYAEDGSILPAIDEFNLPYGGAFCGEDEPYLAGFEPADVRPYSICIPVDIMMALIKGFFDLTDEEAELPILESRLAGVTATRIGPLPIREADGSITTDNVLIGFFPGEPTSMYTEQFRRRAAAELGFTHSVAVGYAQDHEGYLLIPEDWLQGGYEADINVWGPLQAEHIMEGLLTMAGEVLTTDVLESQDPCGQWQPPDYGAVALPTEAPDISADAGTFLDEAPEHLYNPLTSNDEQLEGIRVELTGEGAVVPRVQGLVQFAWLGGDPGVDWPMVTLEHQTGADAWEPVLTSSGRPVTSGPDILVATTPDPLAPSDVFQAHAWWTAWQAVGHSEDRAGLELGMYRLHIVGKEYVGGGATWPWPTGEYELYTPPFEVVPATITVWADGTSIRAALDGPARGYRLVGMDGNARGHNPLPGDVAWVTVTYSSGESTTTEVTGTHGGGSTVLPDVLTAGDIVSVEVEDTYGNVGTLSLE